MNGLAILIPEMFYMLAAEHPPRESTPALSDDTGSSSSRESSPPATPVSGLSRAPSISFDDNSKHIPTGDGTDIKILEPDADSSPPEDITRPLKRRRLVDTWVDKVRAERVLPPDISSDATKADDGALLGLVHILIGDCASVRGVKPDAVDPSLEYVFRPLKRKRFADTSTDDACAKRAQTSDISSGAAKIEDSVSFDLGHIPIHDCTKIRVAEPDDVHPVSPHIDLHVSLKAIARPPKRKRCADTTTDEVRVKRRRLSDSPSHASKLNYAAPSGPHPRCMITGCVSNEVEACYILPPDTPQPLDDLRASDDFSSAYCSTPANIVFLRHDLRILWETNRLLMIPHPHHLDHPDTRPAYKYCVVVEDEHPSGSCIPKYYTITPPVAMACSSYRSLGWHDLSANLHLMTIRVGREFMKRPLHYEHHLFQNNLSHIPTITPVHPDVVEPVFSQINRDSPVEVILPLPKRKRSPDIEADEVPAKKMRMSVSTGETAKVEDGVPFGPHPRCMITGCVSADVEACYILPPDMPQLLVNRKMDYITFNMRTNYDTFRCHAPRNIIFLRRDLRELWETNRLLMIPHPDHLKKLDYCPPIAVLIVTQVYKYCVIAEDVHPPDSCATMGYFITPSIMTAPCSYRSLGWHELNANLHLMIFRAGQKLNKRPLHYQHILRDLLPFNDANHAYSIVWRYGSWTFSLHREMVPDRRLWATGELSACPDDYFRSPKKQYCSPMLDDDTVRFSRRFWPIVSGIQRKRSGNTSVGTQACIVEEDAQRSVSVRQWCLDCDQDRDEWTMGPPAEPEDAELLAYRQEKAGNVLPVVQDLWSLEDHFSSSCGIGCISNITAGRGDDMQLHAWRWRDGVRHLPGVGAYRLASIENIRHGSWDRFAEMVAAVAQPSLQYTASYATNTSIFDERMSVLTTGMKTALHEGNAAKRVRRRARSASHFKELTYLVPEWLTSNTSEATARYVWSMHILLAAVLAVLTRRAKPHARGLGIQIWVLEQINQVFTRGPVGIRNITRMGIHDRGDNQERGKPPRRLAVNVPWLATYGMGQVQTFNDEGAYNEAEHECYGKCATVRKNILGDSNSMPVNLFQGTGTTLPMSSTTILNRGQEVETEVPRAAEAGLYTGDV
ncbi:predicted protein [Postia placenta Mad-698-R]|nr:predicted protein [Postia placenta Mad-698-R]